MSPSERVIAWLKQYPFMYEFVRYQIYSRIQSFNHRQCFPEYLPQQLMGWRGIVFRYWLVARGNGGIAGRLVENRCRA
jgi:hypothetical protein